MSGEEKIRGTLTPERSGLQFEARGFPSSAASRRIIELVLCSLPASNPLEMDRRRMEEREGGMQSKGARAAIEIERERDCRSGR